MTPQTEVITLGGSSARIYRAGPDYLGRQTLTIGEIDFQDARGGAALILHICNLAKSEGYAHVIGPMNGDTWHSYRLVSKSGDLAPFLMEPVSKPHDFAAFTGAGFEVISKYSSARGPLKNTLSDAPVTLPGVSVSPLEGDTNADLIDTIFNFSEKSFANNAFYKPIRRAQFHDLYAPLMGAIDRRFVLMAKDARGQGIGFLFGIPDLYDAGGKTIILKTYASVRRGVGHVLVDHFHRLAIDSGFETVIHALFHEDNISGTRSAQHNAAVFREYALLAKAL